jgi:hypothetical protein
VHGNPRGGVNGVRETIAVDYENHMKHTNTLCGQNAEFQYCHDLGLTIDGVWIGE